MHYFRWMNLIEKNNCVVGGLNGGKVGEIAKGQPLAKDRPDPYTLQMDDDYRKNVKLTDCLYNDQDAIVASPRLRDLLVERLGATVEVLPVWIKDHRKRVASKDYAFINILDVQDCLAIKESQPDYATLRGKQIMLGVEQIVLESAKIGKTAQLFRLAPWLRPMLVREDLVEAIQAAKIEGVTFNPIDTV